MLFNLWNHKNKFFRVLKNERRTVFNYLYLCSIYLQCYTLQILRALFLYCYIERDQAGLGHEPIGDVCDHDVFDYHLAYLSVFAHTI